MNNEFNNQNANYQVQPPNNNQYQETRNQNSNVFTIILLLIVIGLAGFIVYDKTMNEKDNNSCNITNNNNNEQDKNEPDNNVQDELKVIDSYVTTISTGAYKGKTIKIPKLTGFTKTIETLNNKILTNSLNEIIEYKDRMMNQIANVVDDEIVVDVEKSEISNFYDCYNSFNFDYNTFLKNDIITIKVNYELDNSTLDDGKCNNATGDTFDADEYYFYDKKNDKELTLREAAERLTATFNADSQCKTYNDLSNLDRWGTLNIELKDNQTMNITCFEEIG